MPAMFGLIFCPIDDPKNSLQIYMELTGWDKNGHCPMTGTNVHACIRLRAHELDNVVLYAHIYIRSPVHYSKHLFSDVLSPSQRPRLDEVLKTPRVRELVVFPGIINSQQSDVIPFSLVKLRFLLIRNSLFLLDKKVLSTQSLCPPLRGEVRIP